MTRAGYLRTEIASFLGIRYQHVRKVLIGAGITEGIRRQEEVSLERERVVVEVTADDETNSSAATSWEVLLRAGFHFLGEWRGENEDFQIDAKAPVDAGVYSFVVDDVVKYVGLTQRGLRSRLDGYRRGYERQRTNARVKALRQEAISAGKRVKVLVAVPSAGEWKGPPVNTAAGLEAGLISMIQPPWNILGVTSP
ncbi:GIY-YIG nuclease family protein [Agrobacterium sp. 22094]|uniref:GIY-YIG nuclease family protein n=1 Tax=Agrobacterium sp. 22094 TaxID=3453872 RepID=UPI003F86B98E